MKIYIILLLICLVFIPSCKKFEDGPLISFRSEDKRLEGEWLLKYWTVDGVDSLQYWNNYFGSECHISFSPHNETGINPFGIFWGDTAANFYILLSGSWTGFQDQYLLLGGIEDSNSTAFPLSFLLHSHPLAGLSSSEWITTKLKYNDFWFEVDVDSRHYELHLECLSKF